MAVEIRQQAFDPYIELVRHQAAFAARGKYGATASFVGTMRDFNEGAAVRAMTLEHYPVMTEKHLARICEEASRRWEIMDALVVHRVGLVVPDEPIVLVAVWAAHRAAGFDACRYLVEELKTRAPFWKHEDVGDRVRWVEKNT